MPTTSLYPTPRESMVVKTPPDPQDSLAALLNLPDHQVNRNAMTDSLKSTDQYGRPDYRVLNDFLTGEQKSYDTDPMAQRYRDVGKAQTGAIVNDLPEVRNQRHEQQQFEIAKASAPAQVTGQYGVQEERVKGANAMDLADANRAGTEHLMTMLSGGGQPGQAGGAPSSRLKPSVDAQGRLSFTTTPPPQETAQTRTMGETANDILDVLSKTGFEQQAKDMQAKGLFSPGVGWLRRTAIHHGLGSFLGQDQATTQGLGQFESAKDMLVSAVQRAHAGARGAGNEALASRFEQMLNDSGDLDTFLGQLHGVIPYLQQYASHNPDGGTNQPVVDPYSDPNWGAK